MPPPTQLPRGRSMPVVRSHVRSTVTLRGTPLRAAAPRTHPRRRRTPPPRTEACLRCLLGGRGQQGPGTCEASEASAATVSDGARKVPRVVFGGVPAVTGRGPRACWATQGGAEEGSEAQGASQAGQAGVGDPLDVGEASGGEDIEEKEKEDSLGVRAALAALRFYKREISPILPPSCRFLPTCSEYAMESYKKFGVPKGSVLTLWRIMRCTPFGDSGYDPPKWPPPHLAFIGDVWQ